VKSVVQIHSPRPFLSTKISNYFRARSRVYQDARRVLPAFG
jgi:hypothetical protein